MSQRHIVKDLSAADCITLLASLLIIVALGLLWHHQTYLAISLAFVSMFLDYLDGTIARKYTSSAYGKVLDSLYDIVGFVLFPILTILILTNWAWWAVAIAIGYYLSASIRLARFTNQGYVGGDKRYYVGLPVLFSKYALLAAYLVNGQLAVMMLALMIPLMISSRRVKKPHPFFAQLNLAYALIFLILYLK